MRGSYGGGKRLFEERRPEGWGDVPATVLENFIKVVVWAVLLFGAAVITISPLLNWLVGNECWFYW